MIIKTTAEVWAVIHARHREDLVVFSSYSAPDGDEFGNSDQCIMKTEYGFERSDYPLIGAETRWDKGSRQATESTEYWLCINEAKQND